MIREKADRIGRAADLSPGTPFAETVIRVRDIFEVSPAEGYDAPRTFTPVEQTRRVVPDTPEVGYQQERHGLRAATF
ncbi:hypothetical protein [Microbispora bryophytorum]|uniref:hypothetical protein n=1 Tax=Microbispora bryophytorum TaxID=1460882 RepID=UPI0033DE7ED3